MDHGPRLWELWLMDQPLALSRIAFCILGGLGDRRLECVEMTGHARARILKTNAIQRGDG